MKALYEFMCSDSHVTDEYCDYEVKETNCSICNKTAKRIVSSGIGYFKIDGFRSDLMTEKWAKTRINNSRKHNENNG